MSETNFVEEYFNATNECFQKFSSKTIVFMQNGVFFELYGYKVAEQDKEASELQGSLIEPISKLCGLNVSLKKGTIPSIPNANVYMTGIRDYVLESMISTITNAGYTMAIYIQKINDTGKTKKITRVLDKVYSPGTFLSPNDNDTKNTTNYIICVWFHTYNNSSGKQFIYGISAINIVTGESFLLERETTFDITPSTFDEIEQILSIYNPSELILISPFEENIMHSIIQYMSVANMVTPYIISSQSVIAKKCTTQTYIHYLLSIYYGDDTFHTVPEFSTNIIATQSFSYLLYFIRERNPNVIHKMQLPFFLNTMQTVRLANHTLSQLNIIDSEDKHEFSSVLQLLNKCVTVMGQRCFTKQLTSPTFEVEWIEKEYKMIAFLLESNQVDMLHPLRQILKGLPDLDKMIRQLIIGEISPNTFYQLHTGLTKIRQFHECIQLLNPLYDYIKPNYRYSNWMHTIRYSLAYLSSCLHISNCNGVYKTINKWIIQPLYSSELDSKTTLFQLYKTEFNTFLQQFNKYIKLALHLDSDVCKESYSESTGYTIQMTVAKSNTIKYAILNGNTNASLKLIVINDKTFDLKDITFYSLTKSIAEVRHPLLNEIQENLVALSQEINDLSSQLYKQIIQNIQTSTVVKELEDISSFITKTDVIVNKAYLSKKYNYCQPTIDKSRTESYIQTVQLRHALIEHIQQNELYVANDISVGKEERGILIYGTNAVGKTSLIRALGIAVIIAQSGMFVPCSAMTYVPYRSIMSRIIGNDNIHKGLSTFAVEMLELRTILRYSDEHSLILGDELCSGTEQESANSIFVAGLQHLYRAKSSFLFATHLHDIVHFDEISQMEPALVCKHLSVIYDNELDCLVYDRILQPGSGDRMYGLEVCKSLHLPPAFLNEAFDIRNKYYGVSKDKKTTYNANKIRGMCEICGTQMASETHHLQEQKNANEDGFIGTIHKNHTANLASVCNKCHLDMHQQPTTGKKLVRMKTTTGKMVLRYKNE